MRVTECSGALRLFIVGANLFAHSLRNIVPSHALNVRMNSHLQGMRLRDWSLVALLVLGACARQPAQCERPVGQMPEAPHAQQNRRLVTSLGSGAGCHVQVRLPDETRASTWLVERDAAVAAARLAAQSCCAAPRVKNIADWPVGFTAFDVEFDCAAP